MATVKKLTDMDDITPANICRVTRLLSHFGGGEIPTTLSRKTALDHLQPKTGGWRHTPVDESTRRFIKLEQSFLQQLQQNEPYFNGQPRYILQEKMKISSELLLHCTPDNISLQLTNEGSIFYTIYKNDIHLYFEHYLLEDFDGKDESIVSVYKGDEKILDYGGSLAETLEELNAILSSEFIALSELA